ncbi:hypothetical protein COLU111180_04395 [Cohnella lubricantis]|uniref:Flagellar hook-length control protein FliK n=1 Tax=Cohnella lubricantis TaxID=2163172 RepID=A0A841TCP3_9BACL|nr:hypothetical protein [Cohnella lubricantis]MBB6677010.1 hypothetical protein [Cohnella lubricantis]MBP2117069.1 hypothetical protein [Cohnella lubricantis]
MSMNIGAIMKALMGDAQPSDSRALELRIGQIVRGVLLQVMEGGESLLQINGVQVRAQLAADLQVGRSTLLQVQQQSTGSQIVLKPLADASELPEGEALPDAAKSFGLPGQKWSFELLQGLKRDGYPLDRETAGWFKRAADMRPSGIDTQEWMNAAGVAFRRGLAPTETTIASLRQALYGPPVHEQLEALQKLLADFLGQQGGEAAAARGGTAAMAQGGASAAAVRVSQLLAQGSELLAAGGEDLLAEPGRAPQAASAAASGGLAGGAVAQAGLAAGGAGGTIGSAEPEQAADRQHSAAGQAGALPTAANAAQASAGQAPLLASKAAAGKDGLDAAAARSVGAGATAKAGTDADAGEAGSREASAQAYAAGTGASGAEAARADKPWIGRFLQWLGVEHERQAAIFSTGDSFSRQDGTADAAADDGHNLARTGESLKSALLTLASSENVPPQLREAAQAMAQQITGQQLLLASDKQNQAPMSHMTLFVPVRGPDGDTTATIHVQTRKGRRGEWDTGNCRLLFDLRMSHLGDTVVDVQVVDKVVSLKLMNDRPWVAEVMEAARNEAAAGLRAAGFQLLSLKTVPFPIPVQTETSEIGEVQPSSGRIAADAYAAKPYRGVDYRA